MDYQFQLLKTTRENIITEVKGLSLVDVNHIPKSFNNSIGWQVVHILVTQQVLLYKLSGQTPLISSDIIEQFKKGSNGKQAISKELWNEILALLKTTPNNLVSDYKRGLFNNYPAYPTSYGITLNTIEEAIAFNNVHEALHYGTIRAMKRIIT